MFRTLVVFFYGMTALSGPRCPHPDKTHTVGLLWTSVQSVQRSLPDNTQHSRDRYPWNRRDSHQQFQQESDSRPTP